MLRVKGARMTQTDTLEVEGNVPAQRDGDTDATAAVRELIVGYQVTQMLYTAVRLGLPELLKAGGVSVDDVAEATGAHGGALGCLLDAFAHYGLVRQDESGCYHPTESGRTLEADRAGSLRPTVLATGKERYQSWGRLLETVRTGRVAFQEVGGMPLHDFYAAHPAAAEQFNSAMAALSAHTLDAVVDSYDFARHDLVVEVGGGLAVLMVELLNRHPQLHGIVVDLPHVVAETRRRVSDEMRGRLVLTAGDARSHVPHGGDLYLLKTVLCDFSDDAAAAILRACRAAIQPDGTLLVFDKVRRVGGTPGAARTAMSALNLLVMTGGRERTVGEYSDLMTRAGFELTDVMATDALGGEIHRLVARPVEPVESGE